MSRRFSKGHVFIFAETAYVAHIQLGIWLKHEDLINSCEIWPKSFPQLPGRITCQILGLRFLPHLVSKSKSTGPT